VLQGPYFAPLTNKKTIKKMNNVLKLLVAFLLGGAAVAAYNQYYGSGIGKLGFGAEVQADLQNIYRDVYSTDAFVDSLDAAGNNFVGNNKLVLKQKVMEAIQLMSRAAKDNAVPLPTLPGIAPTSYYTMDTIPASLGDAMRLMNYYTHRARTNGPIVSATTKISSSDVDPLSWTWISREALLKFALTLYHPRYSKAKVNGVRIYTGIIDTNLMAEEYLREPAVRATFRAKHGSAFPVFKPTYSGKLNGKDADLNYTGTSYYDCNCGGTGNEVRCQLTSEPQYKCPGESDRECAVCRPRIH
jgi:hypothetical protein